MTSLQDQEKTLIFIGDSLMLQNVQFFICQARRENLTVIENHADRNCYWRFNISHPLNTYNDTSSLTKAAIVQVHFQRIGTLDSVSMCPTSKIGKYKLHNETYTLGKWKDVKRLTKTLIEVCLFLLRVCALSV